MKDWIEHNRYKKGLAKRSLALLLAAGLALTSGCTGVKSATKDAQEKTYQIGVLRIGDSMPLYLADQNGYFKEKGVSVKLVEFSSASDESKAMEAGELDGMMTDLVVTSLINKGGVPVRAVLTSLGADPSEGRFLLVSSPGSGITDPKQLEGSKVGIASGTMMEFLLDSYCEELGIDVEKIEKVQVPNLGTRMEMVMKGADIKAAILPDPLAAFAVSSGANTVIDDTQLSQNDSVSVITLTEEMIKNNTDSAQAVVDAITMAMEEINKDPEKVRDQFLNVAKVPDTLKEDYPIPTYTPQSIPDQDYVQRIQDWMVQKGLLDKGFDYDQLVNHSFLK